MGGSAESRPNRWEVTAQEPTRACVFIDPTLTSDGVPHVPVVSFDGKNSQLPCNNIIPGKSIRVGLPATPVPEDWCRRQRAEGLCLRDLGLDVPQNLRKGR